MDWYEAEVRELEAAVHVRKNCASLVAFYGSSSIRLWTTLARDLQIPDAVNLGFGGSTLAACVHFFERVLLPAAPRSLVIYAGDNDLGDGRSPDHVANSFHELTRKVDGLLGGIPLSFISVKPSPARRAILDKVRRTNTLIREAIEKRTNNCFINVFDAMLKPDGHPNETLYTDDGLHMSKAGYRLWTELLLPFREIMVAGRP